MFDSLVVSVLAYGVEIWGWSAVEEMERMQKKYLKWILDLERSTPDCIIYEETKREKLRLKFTKLAAHYESRKWKTERIVKECLRERKKSKGLTKDNCARGLECPTFLPWCLIYYRITH